MDMMGMWLKLESGRDGDNKLYTCFCVQYCLLLLNK